ncbi:hypothetical protein GN956_G8276 [Arapaima gigas]
MTERKLHGCFKGACDVARTPDVNGNARSGTLRQPTTGAASPVANSTTRTRVHVPPELCSRGVSAARSMVSPAMKAVVDAVWAVWSIGASIYDYLHTSAMEERIHALENVITIHQCVIGVLSAGLVVLITYILLRKH